MRQRADGGSGHSGLPCKRGALAGRCTSTTTILRFCGHTDSSHSRCSASAATSAAGKPSQACCAALEPSCRGHRCAGCCAIGCDAAARVDGRRPRQRQAGRGRPRPLPSQSWSSASSYPPNPSTSGAPRTLHSRSAAQQCLSKHGGTGAGAGSPGGGSGHTRGGRGPRLRAAGHPRSRLFCGGQARPLWHAQPVPGPGGRRISRGDCGGSVACCAAPAAPLVWLGRPRCAGEARL